MEKFGGANNFRTGGISELKAQLLFLEEGYDVFTPITLKTRQDFIAVKGASVERVQVKTAQNNGGYIQARLDVSGARYTKEDTDYIIFLYEDRIWKIPVERISNYPSVCLGKLEGTYKPRNDLTMYEIKEKHEHSLFKAQSFG